MSILCLMSIISAHLVGAMFLSMCFFRRIRPAHTLAVHKRTEAPGLELRVSGHGSQRSASGCGLSGSEQQQRGSGGRLGSGGVAV
jgi:hypothetical protein